MPVNFFRFFNKCFHCVISAQKEHPESGIWCTSTCSRFREWLHITSQGDCLQTVRTLDIERRLPLVRSYLRRLESWSSAVWQLHPQYLQWWHCIVHIYARFSLLASKRDREIQRSTVALLSFVCCCEWFSNPYTPIRKTKKNGLEQARPGISCAMDCT